MTNNDFDKLKGAFDDAPKPSDDAKKRALMAAMQAFEKNTQENAEPARPTLESATIMSRIIKGTKNMIIKKQWIYGVAGIAIGMIGMHFIGGINQLPTSFFGNQTSNRSDHVSLYGSTQGTVFDIIQTTDPSSFSCLSYQGIIEKEIWDKRVNGEPNIKIHKFIAEFSDGVSIDFLVNAEFGDRSAAQEEAMLYTKAIGQLPTNLRSGLPEVRLHKGSKSPHSGSVGLTMYHDTSMGRIKYNHLEETLFHESVHAAWDDQHRLSRGWVTAQKADGQFMTEYGARNPEREDLAETALFAFALIKYPNDESRLPPADSRDVKNAIPNRLAYIEEYLINPKKPIFESIGPAKTCD